MRLVFICGFAWQPKGTAPARAHPIAAELARRGHEVTLLLTPYDNSAQSGMEWEEENVRIKSLKCGASPWSYPALLARLIREIEACDPDIVHVFKPKGFAGAAGTYLLLKGFKSVVLDCDDWEGWGGWNEVKNYPWLVKEYIDRQERWMTRRAPVVTVASRSLWKRSVGLRQEPSDVYYVPNCGASSARREIQKAVKSISQDQARHKLGFPDGSLVFYSGHFEPGEDVLWFCKVALPAVIRNNGAFVFVGEGPQLDNVKAFFSNYPGARVMFLPRLPYDQYLLSIWASDVTAFPYQNDQIYQAKCSVRIVDYMAMERSVITTAVGENLEYIEDGESGILTSPGDEQAFESSLEDLLRNRELRCRLGRNAQKRIAEKFSWSGEPLRQCLAAYHKLQSTW